MTAPLVSIIVPVFDDEATVAAAVESALAQTIVRIEVICVDDCSADGTVGVIEQMQASDDRVRLLRHDRNRSAFEARRTGILAARADYVLFLDGDDELAPDAAQRALAAAETSGADLVGFGVTVLEHDGRSGSTYERRLQPMHRRLDDGGVLAGLFPVGKPAQGQLWRYLFRTQVLRDACALLDGDFTLGRVNDLPLMFLVAALATRYVSIEDRLYRYHFGRGGSGHRVDTHERAVFYASAIESIDSIRPAIDELARKRSDADTLRASYESVRLSIIGYVCFQLVEKSDGAVLDDALAHLHTVAPAADVVRAAARFYPEALSTLRFHTAWQGMDDRRVRSILLATSTLRTGGVSAVLASQARYLRAAGHRVTIVARGGGSDRDAVPAGAEFIELRGRSLADRLEEWGEICRAHEVDIVIDHQVLYTPHWPEFALTARAEGAATIGWLHNFVGRPIYDGTDRLTLIERCAATLAQLIVLSPLDVAYFRLRGVTQTAYLPNPPSPLMLDALAHPAHKSAVSGRLELVWWGRLEQRTKQVFELIEVAAQLRRLGCEFRLTVIGPDWDDVTAKTFNARARRRGLSDRVAAVGALRGQKLVEAIDAADAFVSTSIIEGYQLTIAEAQSRGLPVYMYELPWLTLVQGNEGIVTAPQGDAAGLARRISDIARDPERYLALSRAATEAAAQATGYDFAHLYQDLIAGSLPAEFSPEPSLDDASRLLGLMAFFAEKSHRRGRSTTSDASIAARLWQSASPAGRATLRRLPGLRPLAHRLKKWLLAR
ncbi:MULTISPECIES: glycosyltransferase [unclassified Microbacterium]|uniref:glycosyltransferase n=1 Tax=unclassified Microbacterium TaxID=2609290 RepID=UPI003016BCD3